MNFPKNYYFTREHEWICMKDGFAYVGLTEWGLKELGEIDVIEIASLSQYRNKDQVFGQVRGGKFITQLIMPIDGFVIRVNESFNIRQIVPENWLIMIKPFLPVNKNNLLSPEEYKSYGAGNLLRLIRYLT